MKDFILTVLGFVTAIAFLVSFTVCIVSGADAVRRGAIVAGVAEWQVDPKTGETFFVWKKVVCGESSL